MGAFRFENRADDLRVICNKVCNQGKSTGVDITFINKSQNIFAPIRVTKSELLNPQKKFGNLFLDFDFDLTEVEIEKVINIARDSLMNDEAYETSGKDNIIDVIKSFHEKATNNPSEETAFRREDNLYIAAEFLDELLKGTGWKNLEFKRQLRNLRLLITNESRGYDILVNASRVQNTTKKYTCIKLKSNPHDLIDIEAMITGVEVA